MHTYPLNRSQAYELSAIADDLAAAGIPSQRRALWLHGKYSPDICQAAIELLTAREKAPHDIPMGNRLFYTKAALEQSSCAALAKYHATLFPPGSFVVDAGCGIGMDTLAIASNAHNMLSIDLDPVHCLYTRLNSEIIGLSQHVAVVKGDVMQCHLEHAHNLFADPMRRNESGRLLDPSMWSPPLSYYLNIEHDIDRIVIKASPMLKPDAALMAGRQIRYIEWNGECREALICCGRDIDGRGTKLAVNLTSGSDMLTIDCGLPAVRELGRYLIDPSPSILAADMLPQLASNLSAWRVSSGCGYLSSDALIPSAFTKHYQVVDCIKYHRKELMRYIKHQSVRGVVLKKWGLPADFGSELTAYHGDGQEEMILAAFPVDSRTDVWIARLLKTDI